MKREVCGKFVRILLALAIGFLWSQAPTSAIASAETGDTPFDAITLEESGDTGSLGPGESRWYSFSQTATGGSLEVDQLFGCGHGRASMQENPPKSISSIGNLLRCATAQARPAQFVFCVTNKGVSGAARGG